MIVPGDAPGGSGDSNRLRYWGLTNMVILLAFDPCEKGPKRAHRGIPASARGRARRGEGNCKSIYIRSRRACDKFASTLCLFGRMATWRRATLQTRTYSPYLINCRILLFPVLLGKCSQAEIHLIGNLKPSITNYANWLPNSYSYSY